MQLAPRRLGPRSPRAVVAEGARQPMRHTIWIAALVASLAHCAPMALPPEPTPDARAAADGAAPETDAGAVTTPDARLAADDGGDASGAGTYEPARALLEHSCVS